jgi:hypothetical protein
LYQKAEIAKTKSIDKLKLVTKDLNQLKVSTKQIQLNNEELVVDNSLLMKNLNIVDTALYI